MSLYRRWYLPIMVVLGLWIGLGLVPSSIAAPLDMPGESTSASAHDTPTTLVPDGVAEFTLVEPKIFWHTKCSPTTGESISRIATHGSLVRQLFFDPICNQQGSQIQSNIAGDANYVYWLGNDGLMRLSTNANVGDPAELLSSVPGTPDEVVDDDEYVYALTHSNINYIIWRVKKSDGTFQPLASTTANGKSLSSDSAYLYWLEDGNLRRLNLGTSNLTTIATGVGGYYAEGPRTICGFIVCYTVHLVFYAQGNQVIKFNNLDDSAIPIYTATDEGSDSALITSLTSDEDDLFFLERRNVSCEPGLICMRILLQRIPRGGGTATTLYASGDLATVITTGDLKTDDTFLFWRQDGSLLRLPNNAAALPQVNVRLTRIEVTQAVQNEKNSVPQIQDKRTFVRAHVRSDGGPVPGVGAWLYGSWDGGNGGPLLPVNNTGIQITVQPSPFLADVNQSFLFELPMDWTKQKNLVLQVNVNPHQVPLEPIYVDNNSQVPVPPFVPSPRLEAQFVGFGYTIDGQTWYPQIDNDVDRTYSWMRRAFPVASTPGFINDSTPGFRPNYWPHYDKDLGAMVDDRPGKQHVSCLDLPLDRRNTCAARHTNDKMLEWRTNPLLGIPNDRFLYGLTYFNFNLVPTCPPVCFGFPRGGATHSKVSSGVAFGQPNIEASDEPSAVIAGHEIAHTTGRAHPKINSANFGGPCTNTKKHGDLDPKFPHVNQQIGPNDNSVLGFNTGDTAFGIPKAAYLPANWFDVMAYCGPNHWVSDYTYECIYKDLMGFAHGNFNYTCFGHSSTNVSSAVPTVNSQAQAGYLIAAGSIDERTGKGTLRRLCRLEDVAWEPPLEIGPYALRQADAGGAVLAEQSFTPSEAEDGDSLLDFFLVVGFEADAQTVQVVRLADDKVIASSSVSPNPPSVTNVTLVDAPDPIEGVVTLRWQASDTDGNTLRFDVLYSADGGATGQPLFTNLTSNQVEIDTAALGGSQTATFLVIAYDGANTTRAQSEPFKLPFKPLSALIQSPPDGTQVRYGQPINFLGVGEDPQGRPITLRWKDATGVVLGSGPTLSMERLPVGENPITLEVITGREIATAEVTVFVEDILDLPGPFLSVAPSQVTWFAAESGETQQTATLSVVNAGGGGDLQWTASEDAPWLTLSASSGSTPATITLTADPSGIPSDTSVSTTLTLTIPAGENESAQTLNIPVSLSIGNVWGPSPPEAKQSIYLPIILRQ